jgi:[acyl-carrier-protein] S-malonyltransferase
MSAGWEAHSAWVDTVQAAERHTGYPLRRLMAEGPLEDLRFQRHAPCAVLAHSMGVFRAWREAGMPLPVAAAGHSMGFYSAMVAAGVAPLEAALDLLATVEDLCEATFADRAMGMAFVIGVPELEVRQALLAHPGLALSNRNGQAQFTVSGPVENLEALVAALQPTAFKIGLLPVKHPLHGPHMTALLPAIARRMGAVAPSTPVFPLISHFDGRLLSTGAAAWDDGLASVALPVDWLAVVARLRSLGAPLAECGHGSQLAGLTRWAERSFQVTSLQRGPQKG